MLNFCRLRTSKAAPTKRSTDSETCEITRIFRGPRRDVFAPLTDEAPLSVRPASMRVAHRAGAIPNRRQVKNETLSAKHKVRTSVAISRDRKASPSDRSFARELVPQLAKSRPNAPPAMARSKL